LTNRGVYGIIIVPNEREVNTMREERIAVAYKTKYIAEDGTKWDTESECEQYEKLMANPAPLKRLKFFDGDGNRIKIFEKKEIPEFSYLVITKELPHYSPDVIKAVIGDKRVDTTSYRLPRRVGVWYNDWSHAHNGSFGPCGWGLVDSIESLEIQIINHQKKIELLKKITKTS
jgi:hypothetical protein